MRGSKMIECVFGKFLVCEELVNLVDILPDFGEVERSKVFEETLIDKVLY
jgi:hypothetical protein